MEALAYTCWTCGMAIEFERVDFKTRRANCRWCKNDVILPRQEISSSDRVVNEVKQSIRFFNEKEFDMAQKYADGVLTISTNHAVGLYIHAYCRAFVNKTKSRDPLNKFFQQTLPAIQEEGGMSNDELEGFKSCVLATKTNVAEYEEEILAAVLANDPDGIVAFTEEFSPTCITMRKDIDWATKTLSDIYKEIGTRGNLPKTWYALFAAMVTNPISPYKCGFHLKTRASIFLDKYVKWLEDLFKSIPDEALRTKFLTAFANKKREFISKMN